MSPSDLEDEEDRGGLEHFERDLDFLLRDLPSSPTPPLPQQRNGGGRAFVDIQRSGSAPPTVEGSLSAIRGLMGSPGVGEAGAGGGLSCEEEIRSRPAYLPYHYTGENRNPRLLPPALSREDWRVAQRVGPGAKFSHVDGVLGDWRKGEMMGGGDVGTNSLFSLQSGVSAARDRDRDLRMMGRVPRNSIRPEAAEWDDRGNNGSTSFEFGPRRKSFADALQEELSQPTALPAHMSRSTRHNSFGNFVDPVSMSNGNMKQARKPESVDSSLSPAVSSHLIRMRSFGSSASHSFASGLGLPRSTTPDPQLVRRSPSPCLPPIGAKSNMPSNDCTKSMANQGDIAIALSGINLAEKTSGENHGEDRRHQEFTGQSNFLLNVLNDKNHYPHHNVSCSPGTETGSPSDPAMPMMACKDSFKKNGILSDNNLSKFFVNGQGYLSKGLSPRNNFATESFSISTSFPDSSSLYDKMELPNMGYAGTNTKSFTNQKYTETTNQLDSDGRYLERSGNQVGQAFQVPTLDPLHGQFVQRANSTVQPAFNFNDHALGRSCTDISHLDISYQKAYVGALIAQQELQYGMPFHGKSTGLNQGFRGNTAYGPGLPYPTKSLSSPIISSHSAGNPPRINECLLRYPLLMKNPRSGSLGPRAAENVIRETGFGSSFLEEFKNNKARSFELSEIVGHVVEFSTDQYGSRFIQQKLETASVEEKIEIFPEILPHAHALMTDVFGNYVIQKFFEHGTKSQRTELANQLKGQVLALSLQMYGCRVIQKALEVVDEDEQTQMVSELDGSVIKCVRDQNGNHVIQKCIECVPQEKIQFIISTFYGQIVVLSTHPYGCRVIQRVLENCDVKTQSIIMEEILQSVTTLALDQYGNYVVQHVLQHGKPKERSAIISMLLGQIVDMSQQKFASNVVEKCLTYGTAEERQLLINEMLGSTDENEPLQAMMKDQFGNYVVQKVLDLCDDHNRELILSRIKIHLTTLKRFTYGKHIVARVEKLVTNEERRMGIPSYSS